MRFVGTAVVAVEPLAEGAQPAVEDAPDFLDERLGHEAARHAALVGDHHGGVPGAAQQPHGVEAPREQPQALEAVEMADVLVERAVAVEKYGRSHVPDGEGVPGILPPGRVRPLGAQSRAALRRRAVRRAAGVAVRSAIPRGDAALRRRCAAVAQSTRFGNNGRP